jgi:hypothetical protein
MIFASIFLSARSPFDRWRSALVVSFLWPRFARRAAFVVAFSGVSGVA